jgi:threonylcarbamoyladenosine tRNA methylthiotransferase MtaB
VKTFCIQTLGCKVNQYEGEQLAQLLRARGLTPSSADQADLRLVHTCSVTVQAASKSRQTVRRAIRLPLLDSQVVHDDPLYRAEEGPALAGTSHTAADLVNINVKAEASAYRPGGRPRVVVTGCWATSDREAAAALPGVDAVLTNRDDVAAELDQLLALWREDGSAPSHAAPQGIDCEPASEPSADDGWNELAGTPAGRLTQTSRASVAQTVKENSRPGMTGLPVLGQRQVGRQRAFLKVQDGCDAHCTYCIIPRLRPALWSKPVETVVDEARLLVASGHAEIVLTGIFLGAFGQPTALRRRQPAGGAQPIGELVAALCTRVPGLRRLRLSSLEPGDLTPELLAVLREHPQVVPHFHLPLQSGSDRLLRRMNRQYTRDDFLRMLDRVHAAFDRPALTTDVIVGFPGETDDAFQRTVEVVERAGFIYVHAFSFSPRPGTAAARWGGDFVHGPVVNERIEHLNRLAASHSLAFRRQFVGETVELLTETGDDGSPHRHGRSERYFDVTVPAFGLHTGDVIRARVTQVTPEATFGEVLR